jgi:hypothetical protein
MSTSCTSASGSGAPPTLSKTVPVTLAVAPVSAQLRATSFERFGGTAGRLFVACWNTAAGCRATDGDAAASATRSGNTMSRATLFGRACWWTD